MNRIVAVCDVVSSLVGVAMEKDGMDFSSIDCRSHLYIKLGSGFSADLYRLCTVRRLVVRSFNLWLG